MFCSVYSETDNVLGTNNNEFTLIEDFFFILNITVYKL